jgi:hypothetical protein
VGQDWGNGLGLGEDRDEGEGFLAGWTGQGEDLIDPNRSELEEPPTGMSGRGWYPVSAPLPPLGGEPGPWVVSGEEEGDREPQRRGHCPPGPGP